MTPDFTPYLMHDEQIMWQGESHKEGPIGSDRDSRSTRFFGILWTVMTTLMFVPMIFIQRGDNSMSTGAWAVVIIMAVIFIGVGIGLIVSTFVFRHEFYCLTDRRLIIMSDKGSIKETGELIKARSAELVAIENGFGTIVIVTNIIHYTHSKGHRHSHRVRWKIISVENPIECFRILTALISLNTEGQ